MAATIDVNIEDTEKVPLFSNHIIVRGWRNEFILDFCFIDPMDLEKAESGEMTRVPGKVIKRMSLSSTAANDLIKNLKSNMEKQKNVK